MSTREIRDLLHAAETALEAEIEAVREKPSTDTLLNGELKKSGATDHYDYLFDCQNPSIRFAEEIKAQIGEKSLTVHPVQFEENTVLLRFPEKVGTRIDRADLEWENDFVLKRTLSEIITLSDGDEEVEGRLDHLFDPKVKAIPDHDGIEHDGRRNPEQESAIQKAMQCRTLFIWGPPGTGKTDTLGYIIANYLKRGKRVLFASNTNRAVDVGLISAIHAAREIGVESALKKATRFGDSVLDSDDLEPYQFSKQVEEASKRRKNEAAEWIDLLNRREKALRSVEKRLQDGKQPTSNQELELKLIEQKLKDAGGLEVLEERIDELTAINERKELWKKQLIATTLAKVCTSDLFHSLEFDAVVVDEGSMANLPYLMVLASHAKWHMVVVGDPMQLPPIALTADPTARSFLEKDIFTTVSKADSSEKLFRWHDENPGFTAFFDTQYRLESSLADIISTVFYEGRLKSGKKEQEPTLKQVGDRAYHLIDTSKYNPSLTQKTGERGFRPVNETHKRVLEKLVGNMEQRGIFMQQVGIIVPFRSVVYDLRNLLYNAGLRSVEVGTIHTFQGREKDYIIFDTVMSGEGRGRGKRHYSVRPFDEEKNGLSVPRLLNVAFSRSRKELIVIADMDHIRKVYGGKFLGRLLKRMS